jgi:hypothetical protein
MHGDDTVILSRKFKTLAWALSVAVIAVGASSPAGACGWTDHSDWECGGTTGSGINAQPAPEPPNSTVSIQTLASQAALYGIGGTGGVSPPVQLPTTGTAIPLPPGATQDQLTQLIQELADLGIAEAAIEAILEQMPTEEARAAFVAYLMTLSAAELAAIFG